MRGGVSERDRLLVEERRRRAKAEADAVVRGVAETVALERARGAAIEKPAGPHGSRETPYRRRAGLDFLAMKGRITEIQQAAGARYRDAYRVAQPTAAIGSTLEILPGGSAGGPPLKALVAKAGARQAAEARLALYRRRLMGHPLLIDACDLICGRELTPREAAGGGEREALRLEAVLGVALDLLAGG
jgi:hypothetical protein